jgi:hypothetical protein
MLKVENKVKRGRPSKKQVVGNATISKWNPELVKMDNLSFDKLSIFTNSGFHLLIVALPTTCFLLGRPLLTLFSTFNITLIFYLYIF